MRAGLQPETQTGRREGRGPGFCKGGRVQLWKRLYPWGARECVQRSCRERASVPRQGHIGKCTLSTVVKREDYGNRAGPNRSSAKMCKM